MEQIKRITGDSVHLISVDGDKPLKLSQISTGGGGGTRPHYHGQTEFTPSTVTQTAQTEGLIVDSDITVNPMPIGSAKTPTVNIEANPTITMDGNGLVTASYAKTESITPSVTAGYVASGTAGNVTFRGSSTYQLPSQAATAITPTESAQTAVAAGKYTTGAITVNAIPSNYIGSAVPSGSLSVSGSTVTAASGFYPSAVSANVASGYLGATTVIAGQTASTHTYKVERQAATSGWYDAASVRNAGTVILNNQSISATPTESAQTFTPANSVSYITQVNVAAIPSTYIGSGVPTQSALSVSASTVTAPSGFYSAPASATVAGATHTVGLTTTYKNLGGRMFSITPKDTVSTAGWIAASTWTGNEWMYPALQASTYTPGSTPIVIGSANTMLEGAQTISGDANLVAGNIKSGTTIFGVEGTYQGSSASLITKTITANGTYNAASDNADGYSSVTVNVSGGGGSITQDENGYLVLDPNGGGSGSSYTLLTSAEFSVSTTSTSEITVGTIAAGASAYTGDKILVVSIRDKAGQRAGYYYGSDSFFANTYAKNGSTNTCNMVAQIFCYTGTNGRMMGSSGPYGVYAKSVTSSGVITINARYSSVYQAIVGTFKCDVYLLDWPGGVTPYVPPLEV